MSKTAQLMKAPKGVHVANIEGVDYEVPKTGVIKVLADAHYEVLKRHGFTDHYEEPEDVGAQIEAIDDKDALVEFIEERGGEADNQMSFKKLRRKARIAAELED